MRRHVTFYTFGFVAPAPILKGVVQAEVLLALVEAEQILFHK
jgi:hypothetical protein